MTSSVRVTGGKISALSHATEDPERVVTAMRSIFPLRTTLVPTTTRAKGHYRNEIITLGFTVSNSKILEEFLQNAWNSLPSIDRDEILISLHSRVDKSGTLYVRFDKQEAFKGKIRLNDTDSIKAEISFRSTDLTPDEIVDHIRQKLDAI